MIYLDSSATAKFTETDNIIVDTITNAMKRYWKNPSSLYATDVKNKIDECRANIAEFIGAKTSEIYFTSGSSESNNWAIKGWVNYTVNNTFYDDIVDCFMHTPRFITTPIEHKSILDSLVNIPFMCIDTCCVDKYGLVDCELLKNILKIYKDYPILVSIGMANNEIGTIQDIRKVSNLVHKYNGVLHVDATQALPHIPINVESLGIDMLSASGHKISPVLKGIGFLYKKDGINISPLIYGSQENGLRGGTENTFGIIGLSKAVELCDISAQKTKELCDKRDYFIKRLVEEFGCTVNGSLEHRLVNNVNVTFPQNITGESLLYTLDMSDIFISVGSACNSHSFQPSHVLEAIGLSDEEAMRSVRFSLSDNITYEDIDYVIQEIGKAIMLIECVKE